MQPSRLFDIMIRQAQVNPRPDALAARIDGQWVKYASAQVTELADAVSLGLLAGDLAAGDRVALISMNRPEWTYCDLGIQQLGGVTVPIYPTATAADYEYILAHSQAKVVLVSTAAILARVQAVRDRLPHLKEVYAFDRLPGCRHLSELVEAGRASGRRDDLAKARDQVAPGALASLIYTSGTTGTPKGVMLTHANLLANVEAIAASVSVTELKVDRALSFLPLSHVYERTVNYFYQDAGISIYFAESLETVARDLKEVRPHVFVTVPRLLEKIYEGIAAESRRLTGSKRRLADWALTLGLVYDPDVRPRGLQALKLAVARKLVYARWLDALGGRLKLIIVGGSALQPRLGRVFAAAGLSVLEGYGLTETSPVIAVNTPTVHRLGTVGAVLPNVQVKIQPEDGYRPGEGEILVKGPSVMQGYYQDPEATRAALDADGWFHTGDIGLLEEGRFLKLTDRKKEMFKTSGGKYIAPLALESKVRESPYVAQVMVVGENRKFPAALVVPEAKALESWCRQSGVPFGSLAEAVSKDPVRELYASEIERLNQGFGQWEKIKKFRLITDEWGIATGELTPKLSLKRKVILAKYQAVIEGMYARAGDTSTP